MDAPREVFIFLIAIAIATPIAILAAAASGDSDASPVRRFVRLLVVLVTAPVLLARYARVTNVTYSKRETFLGAWLVVFFISVLVLIKHLPDGWGY